MSGVDCEILSDCEQYIKTYETYLYAYLNQKDWVQDTVDIINESKMLIYNYHGLKFGSDDAIIYKLSNFGKASFKITFLDKRLNIGDGYPIHLDMIQNIIYCDENDIYLFKYISGNSMYLDKKLYNKLHELYPAKFKILHLFLLKDKQCL
jgi:hypothetical protein